MARVDMKWGGVYRSGSKEGCENRGGGGSGGGKRRRTSQHTGMTRPVLFVLF